jgi:hypothetical protein
MAHSIPRQTKTQADDLRDLLENSYKLTVSIKGAGAEQATALLHNLDRIHDLFPRLEAQGVDLRPERGRWEEVQGAVRRHASQLRAELTPAGGLKALREALPSPPDPEERWWWWLDVTARKHLGKRVLVTVAVLAGILLLMLGGIWAFNKLSRWIPPCLSPTSTSPMPKTWCWRASWMRQSPSWKQRTRPGPMISTLSPCWLRCMISPGRRTEPRLFCSG